MLPGSFSLAAHGPRGLVRNAEDGYWGVQVSCSLLDLFEEATALLGGADPKPVSVPSVPKLTTLTRDRSRELQGFAVPVTLAAHSSYGRPL